MKTKLIFGLLIFGMIFLIWIILASALTPEEELTQLEQELTDAGFEWLINYSVDYPEVEVYEKDKDVLIALFESIKTEGWYQIFFDGSSGAGLGEGEEQDAFDLRVVGGYVEFDYVVDPPISECRELNESDTIYTLSQNVTSTSTCFTITAPNVTLDCNGYSINYSSDGTLGYGVYSNQDFSTIRNCDIREGVTTTNNKYGIYFVGATNGTIENNTISTSGTRAHGIYLLSSSNNNSLSNNSISTSGRARGILLSSSSTNYLSNNQVNSSKSISYVVYGTESSHYNHSIDTSNLAEGLPVLYNYSVNDIVILEGSNNEYGQVICGYCNNVTYNNVIMGGDGINLFYTSNSVISNSNITTNLGSGFWLYYNSNNNTIKDNIISTSGWYGYGIQLSSSSTNTLSNNTISTSERNAYGIFLSSSSTNTLSNNTISTSGSWAHGIDLHSSTDNYFKNTNVKTTNFNDAHAIRLQNSKVNATFVNSVINSTNNFDIYTHTDLSAGSQLVLINVTFDKDSVSINDDDFTLFNQYYFDVNVTNTTQHPLDSAQVIAYYNNGTQAFNELTHETGLIQTQNTTEYFQNATAKYYLTPYSINTYKTDYQTRWDSVNFTTNYQLNIYLNSSAEVGLTVSSLGLSTQKTTVNYNEDVNLTLVLPESLYEGYNLSTVWAQVTRPDNSKINITMLPIGDSYDDETKILTTKGWKFFSELDKTEEVATLNSKTGELEWQTPTAWPKRDNSQLGGEMFKIVLEDGSELVVTKNHKVYAEVLNKSSGYDMNLINNKKEKDGMIRSCLIPSYDKYNRKEYLNISEQKQENLISFIMMSKENENDSLVFFINPEFEDKTPHYMHPSLTSEFSSKGFVVIRVEDNLIDFIAENLFKNRILSNCFVNAHPAFLFNNLFISHDLSNISDTELNLMNFPSFNDFFNSSTCSGLGGNSSTGCQSICSQNSQSSSVTSLVSLYLLDMSCFINSIKAFPSNLDAASDCNSLGNFIFISSINNSNSKGYLKFSKEEIYSDVQNNFENSDLLNTCISDCFFNSLSSETIEAFNSSANATKSTSFKCSGINETAFGICLVYLENGTNLIVFFNLDLSSSNSLEERDDFLIISDLCFSNSVIANSGEYILCPANNNFLINEPFQKKENNLFVSNTNFIYKMPLDLSSFNLSCLTFSPNSSASCSVNVLFDTIDSVISASTLLTNSLTTLAKANLNSSLNSGAISTLMQNSSINNSNSKGYLKFSNSGFSLQSISEIYPDELDKKDIYFLDSDNKKLKVTSIEKINYSGMIYSVDVPNDIILVQRENSSKIWSGNSETGIFNATYTNTGLLGNYQVRYFANLTNQDMLFDNVYSDFTVQNTSISINHIDETNTMQTINIDGIITRWNSTDYWDIPNNPFIIQLNNVTVSSNFYNYSGSDFPQGTGENIEINNQIKLNLTSESENSTYTDDYTTTKYTNDAYSYFNVGYHAITSVIFYLHSMDINYPVGNITYKYTSPTEFYNANVYVTTHSNPSDPGGNTSLWFSLNNENWNLLDHSTSPGITLTGTPDVNGHEEFYIMIQSDTFTHFYENPVTRYEINHTSYDYSSSGYYLSDVIHIPDVAYTVLRWTQELNSGQIKLQLREGDDGVSWDEWSQNFTNNLDSRITDFTKPYLQFRAWLSTPDLSLTPVLQEVDILYFNASTNSTGGYNYNITIPTDSLGVLPIEVSVEHNPETGIVGSNTTFITVWAETEIPYAVIRDYSQDVANYSVQANFTRTDINELVNGTINITISNATGQWTQMCYGKQCTGSWKVPTDLSHGNYTININAFNESAYYRNASTTFDDYLEEKSTTGTLFVEDAIIGDFQSGTDYHLYWNATINNTGKASMHDVFLYFYPPATSPAIKSVSEITPCARILPGESCDAVMLITIDGGALTGDHGISWRGNWTNNDKTIGPNDHANEFIQYTDMVITISVNATMALSKYSKNLTIQHESSGEFDFYVQSVGTDNLANIDLTLIQDTLPGEWVDISPSFILGIAPANQQKVDVTVNVPAQTSPGNYTSIINVNPANSDDRNLTLNVEVPVNTSWIIYPETNFTYNITFELNVPGIIANYTLENLGNIDILFEIDYSPSGTTDYTGFGTALFEENYVVGAILTNPTTKTITKGESEEIILYQKGRHTSLVDVGIIMGVSNDSGAPLKKVIEDSFHLIEAPPNITNIWFILDGVYGNKGERNKNLTIKVRATDDVALNKTATKINVSYGMITVELDAIALEVIGEYSGPLAAPTVQNYSANFSVVAGGTHYVKALVKDQFGLTTISETYTFTSYGTTTLSLLGNISEYNTSKINRDTGDSFVVNFQADNTGEVMAYDVNLTFSQNQYITQNPSFQFFENIGFDSSKNQNIEFLVSPLTPPGAYDVTAELRWRNPDNSQNSDTEIIRINVEENKSMQHTESIILAVPSGATNFALVQINNTGNVQLTNMNLVHDGTFELSANETSFSIPVNSSRIINVSIIAPEGTPADIYSETIDITGDLEGEISLSVTVPESRAWDAVPKTITAMVGAEEAGDLETINITNFGNVLLSFELSSTNSSLININESSFNIGILQSKLVMINYTSPDEEGSFQEQIIISSSGSEPEEISVNVSLTVTVIELDIFSPTNETPIMNVLYNDTINVVANASYQNETLTNESIFSISIGGTSCETSYEFNGSLWEISCPAPELDDGAFYDLSLTIEHETLGTRTATQTNAVFYEDLTPPVLIPTRNHINIGQNINLVVNVTDNLEVDSVWAVLINPLGEETNISFTFSGGLYINNTIPLNIAGEYLVNYSANDTTGNTNSSVDWFEVYDFYDWILNFRDYKGDVVSNINISFYRPDTTILLLNNETDSEGHVSFRPNKRFYDLNIEKLKAQKIYGVKILNANFTDAVANNLSLNLHLMNGEDLSEIIPLHRPFAGIASNSTGFSGNEVGLEFNYSNFNYDSPSALSIVRCDVWNYSERACEGTWTSLTTSRDIDARKIFGNSTGFSAYFLTENKCGNGLCEIVYGENVNNCPEDCKDPTAPTAPSPAPRAPSPGPGLRDADLAEIERIIRAFLDVGGVRLKTTSIYKEMFPGETTTARVSLTNTLNSESRIELDVTGDVKPFITFDTTHITLAPNEERDLIIRMIVPIYAEARTYEGDLVLKSQDQEGKVPITIRILPPEGKLLDVRIQPMVQTIRPGERLRILAELLNLGRAQRVDIQFDLRLVDPETGEIITRQEEAFAVETSISEVKELLIPEWTKPGRYMVKGTAYYSNIEVDGDMQATSIAYINVQYPFFSRKLFGISVWMYALFVLFIGALVGSYFVYRYLEYRKKRFKSKVNVQKLPQPGKDSIFMGNVAETGIRTFFKLKDLKTHVLVAGSTGSGKTVASQDAVEGALDKGKCAIIFDPTAQWTGFLRACEEKGMFKRYKYFGMRKSDAKSYDGRIKTIRDPYELINIEKYMNRPGEITIFDISNLSPEEMDIVVASTIQQVFKSKPEESEELKTVIVYDEVHRLLPKFGGSGQGFVQLERGAREFRKWGIGLVLISQVLSDFIGEIKANIGTEVQMGTRYEGDLERVSMKYGEDILKSVAKEPVGTGMTFNAEYNEGRPYFLSYRPLKHSTKALTRKELENYGKYFDLAEDLEYQLAELKKENIDIMDLEIEMKLVMNKVKSGQFNIVDMYLESLQPKIEEKWKSIRKAPRHLEKQRITKQEVLQGVKKAKEEREKTKEGGDKQVKTIDENFNLTQYLKEVKEWIDNAKKAGADTNELEKEAGDFESKFGSIKGEIKKELSDEINKSVEKIKTLMQGISEDLNK